jgi:hypothetical protein
MTDPLYYLEHRTYFTPDGMEALLRRCGCKMLSVENLVSPRQKMARLFAAEGGRDPLKRVLSRAWPVLESASSAARRGNKMLVVGQRSS